MDLRWLEAMLIAEKLRKSKLRIPGIKEITAVDIFVIITLSESENFAMEPDRLKRVIEEKYGLILDATKSLDRLRTHGFIEYLKNPGYKLTERGKKIAEEIKKLKDEVRKLINQDSLLSIIYGVARY